MDSPHPFILQHDYEAVEALPQDGALRQYTRIHKDNKTALFMDCGPDLGHGMGISLPDFMRIGKWLRSLGIRTPDVLAADETNNIAIVEDFGSVTMKQALMNAAPAEQMALYDKAHDVLKTLQQAQCPLSLPSFEQSFMRKARQRFVDWYMPAILHDTPTQKMVQDYHEIWNAIEGTFPPPATSFMHVDFHVENILVLPNGDLGIIDFQEGMIGPCAYDVVNLIEDMRFDVPKAIQDKIRGSYDADFQNWMRVLGTQFHCRLLGQCIRWALQENKPQYMQFMPRLAAYVQESLKDPVLKPFKDWLLDYHVPIRALGAQDIQTCGKYISVDAV